jgi:hypothetical protein
MLFLLFPVIILVFRFVSTFCMDCFFRQEELYPALPVGRFAATIDEKAAAGVDRRCSSPSSPN